MQILVAGLDYGRHRGWDCALRACVLDVPSDFGEPRSLRVCLYLNCTACFTGMQQSEACKKLHGLVTFTLGNGR